MKQIVVCLLAMGFLLPAALGKGKKMDPKVKSIRTVFVEGKDDPWERDARAALGQAKCLKLAPNEESADAVVTVKQSTENAGNPTSTEPTLLGPTARPMQAGPADVVYRSIVDVKIREGNKLKKVWSDTINLGSSDERKHSGVKRLVESFSEDACSE